MLWSFGEINQVRLSIYLDIYVFSPIDLGVSTYRGRDSRMVPEREIKGMAVHGRHHEEGRHAHHGRVGNPLVGRR